MTLLNSDEIKHKNIIRSARGCPVKGEGWRGTTYDTRVGEIVTREGPFRGETYNLKPRGIVWLISMENFFMPDNITGITTLKTSWTKKGLLTLTVGIVDPNYTGPLSTAVINFSSTAFPIRRGDTFFRTAFFEHKETSKKSYSVDRYDYFRTLESECHLHSDSFLTIDTLATEIAPKIIGMPRIALFATLAGAGIAITIALFGLVAPPIFNISSEIHEKNKRIESLENKVENLESYIKDPKQD